MKFIPIAIALLTAIGQVDAKQTNAATIAICPNVARFHVEKSPLRLRGEAQSQMFSALADRLIGREVEVKTDPSVRASRTNKLTAELVAQIAACEDGPGSNVDLVKILRTLIRQVGFRMTPATWKEVEQLLRSDKLYDGQKKTLAEDKAQMKTVEFK